MHGFTNDRLRSAGTHLYGRRTYELMTVWETDVLVAGAHLAAQAIRTGLVDEYQFYVCPIVLGGGTAYLPDDVRLDLELLDERRFDDGRVFLRYAVSG